MRPALLPLSLLFLMAGGCVGTTRTEAPPSAEEEQLLAQLTRDRFVVIDTWERDDLDHLVVTTRQGSARVRYVLKPERPGDQRLNLHKIDDRSVLEVGTSDQLGTGPRPRRASERADEH
jgi:hypothetical protein